VARSPRPYEEFQHRPFEPTPSLRPPPAKRLPRHFVSLVALSIPPTAYGAELRFRHVYPPLARTRQQQFSSGPSLPDFFPPQPSKRAFRPLLLLRPGIFGYTCRFSVLRPLVDYLLFDSISAPILELSSSSPFRPARWEISSHPYPPATNPFYASSDPQGPAAFCPNALSARLHWRTLAFCLIVHKTVFHQPGLRIQRSLTAFPFNSSRPRAPVADGLRSFFTSFLSPFESYRATASCLFFSTSTPERHPRANIPERHKHPAPRGLSRLLGAVSFGCSPQTFALFMLPNSRGSRARSPEKP